MRFFSLFLLLLAAFAARAQSTFEVSLPYVMDGDKIVVKATINGVEGRFLLDTGAPMCVAHGFAARAGIESQGQRANVQDSNGQLGDATVIPLPAVCLGSSPVTFTRLQAMLWPEGYFRRALGH